MDEDEMIIRGQTSVAFVWLFCCVIVLETVLLLHTALALGSGFNLCAQNFWTGARLPPEGTETGGHE